MVHGDVSLIIIPVSIVLLYLSLRLTKLATGHMRITSVSNFFMYNYIVFCFIGSVVINTVYIPEQATYGLYKRLDLLLNVWYYSSAGMILIPLGMIIGSCIFKYYPSKFNATYFNSPIVINSLDISNRVYLILWSAMILSTLALIYFLTTLESTPIISLLRGDIDVVILDQLRSQAGNDYQGGGERMNYIFRTLPIVILLVTFFLRKQGFKWKVLFSYVLLFNVFVGVMELHKAPLLQLILLLILAVIYEKRQVKFKTVIIGLISVSSLVLLMYMFFTNFGDRDTFALLTAPLMRIFITQITPFYFWQQYQEAYGYFWGTTFSNPGGFLPFENVVITKEINDFTFPELADLGIVGSMPTVFYADWFINFGLIGALFSMIFFGLILQGVEVFFIKKLLKTKKIIFVSAFLFVIYYFSQFAGTTFTNLIFDVYLIVPMFFVLSLYIASRFKFIY